jgi:hypothetical protein
LVAQFELTQGRRRAVKGRVRKNRVVVTALASAQLRPFIGATSTTDGYRSGHAKVILGRAEQACQKLGLVIKKRSSGRPGLVWSGFRAGKAPTATSPVLPRTDVNLEPLARTPRQGATPLHQQRRIVRFLFSSDPELGICKSSAWRLNGYGLDQPEMNTPELRHGAPPRSNPYGPAR